MTILPRGAAISEVADRVRNLVERECPVDDRPDRPGFEQLPQLLQVLAALPCDEEAELLMNERRERRRPELTPDGRASCLHLLCRRSRAFPAASTPGGAGKEGGCRRCRGSRHNGRGSRRSPHFV